MTRYVALLRGINVGPHQRIAMADLRALLLGLGHTEVRTYLQSGNAVFTSAHADPERIERDLEARITADLGLTVRCLVRSAGELRGVVERNPFGDSATDPKKLLVAFLSAAPDPARLRTVDPAEFAPEEFRVGEREIYLWCPSGVADSQFNAAFWKRLDLVATARNWNTVTKLLTMTDG